MSYRYDSQLVAGGYHYGVGGLGVKGIDVPSVGGNGPSVLYNDLSLPADNNVEFIATLLTYPSSGVLEFYEDGSFVFSGAPNGAYSFSYALKADGVSLGSATVALVVGGGSITGNAVISVFGASGVVSGAVSIISGNADLDNFQSNGIVSTQGIVVSGNADIDAFLTSGSVTTLAVISGDATISEIAASGIVVSTAGLTDTEMRQMYVWVNDLAKIHGLILGESLQVSQTRRIAADIIQNISGTPDNVVVTRQ